jgi:hypothetical protein
LIDKFINILDDGGFIMIIDNLIPNDKKDLKNLLHHNKYGFQRSELIYGHILVSYEWETYYKIIQPIIVNEVQLSYYQVLFKIKKNKNNNAYLEERDFQTTYIIG